MVEVRPPFANREFSRAGGGFRKKEYLLFKKISEVKAIYEVMWIK